MHAPLYFVLKKLNPCIFPLQQLYQNYFLCKGGSIPMENMLTIVCVHFIRLLDATCPCEFQHLASKDRVLRLGWYAQLPEGCFGNVPKEKSRDVFPSRGVRSQSIFGRVPAVHPRTDARISFPDRGHRRDARYPRSIHQPPSGRPPNALGFT